MKGVIFFYMLEEIILHAGIHKTGTTSIQNTLHNDKNNKILESHGYMYPKSWQANHSYPFQSIFRDDPESVRENILRGYDLKQIKKFNRTLWGDLLKEVTERRSSKLIFSAEDASGLSHESVRHIKERFESTFPKASVKVIIYVRNPITWSSSVCQQLIKNHTQTYAINETKKMLEGIFQKRILKFIDIFGEDRTRAFSFEEATSYKSGLVGHFLSTIGIKKVNEFEMIRSNDSVSQIAAEILSYINEKMPQIYKGKANKNRSEGDVDPIFNIMGPKFDLPYDIKKELLDICSDSIGWLKENFGIDYTKVKITPKNEIDLTDEIINDIKESCRELPKPLSDLVVEFVKHNYNLDLKIPTNT